LHIRFGFFVVVLTVLPAVLMLAATRWFRRLPIPHEAAAWCEEFDYRKLESEPVAAGALLAATASGQALIAGILWEYTARGTAGGLWSEDFSWFVIPVLILAVFNTLIAAGLWAAAMQRHWPGSSVSVQVAMVLLTAGGLYGVCKLSLLVKAFEPEQNMSGFFFVYRSLHLDSGASPLLPMALLLVVICLSTWSHLRGNAIWMTHLPHFGACSGALGQAAAILKDSVGGGMWPMWGGLVWILLSVAGIQIWELWTVENPTYNEAFGIVMGAAYWSMTYLFLRLLRTGHQVRRAAAELEEAGYGPEFTNLQPLRPWGLWEGHSWRSVRAARAKQLTVLGLSLELQGPEAKERVDERVTPESAAMPVQFALAIQLALRILRRQLIFLGACIACTLLAFQSYPFEPRQWITGYVALTSLGMSAAVFVMLVRVEHDPLLGKLFGNAVKGWDLSFYMRTAGALLVPLVTVISSLFPDVGAELSSWLLPWLQSGRQ
jgi:hypothetical protein